LPHELNGQEEIAPHNTAKQIVRETAKPRAYSRGKTPTRGNILGNFLDMVFLPGFDFV
jgi:hypothetical protein